MIAVKMPRRLKLLTSLSLAASAAGMSRRPGIATVFAVCSMA